MLAAFGTETHEDEAAEAQRWVGALLVADAIDDLHRLRVLIEKVLTKKK